MNDVERQSVLAPLVVPGPEDSLVGRWATVVAAVGGHTAVLDPTGRLTFAEADAAADRLARSLDDAAHPADPAPVALFVDNSAVALIGILALLKAGRTLVILDRHQPADRLRQVVALAGSTRCLADRTNVDAAHALGGGLRRVECLEDLLEVPAPPAAVPLHPGSDGDAVTIVFTSGSTGTPKGVVQTHRQFLNEVAAKGARFGLTPGDRVGVLLPFGFAAGFSALMATLLNGAGVAVYEPRDRGVAPFAEWVTRHRVTAVHCTPHLLRSLASVLPPGSVLSTLRYVCTLGEPVFAGDVAAARAFLPPGSGFFNETGSSEMGTLAIRWIADTDPLPPGQVPAGLPIGNKEVRILRADGTPAAIGEAGDIVVVSDYLSGGYWNDPAATAARFGTTDDGRAMIVQGDLGRVDAAGELMMLGRADAAVKIRGYLVEPSEIEAAILAADGVTETVVLAVADPPAPTRLVAYVVPDPTVRTESPAALRRRLRARLPEYMVPGTIVALAALPRNERGKVDRPQLPPAPAREPSEPPTAQWDLVVADIWQRVLGIPEVGLDDDFMALGGDSLTVEEMLAAVRETTDVPLVSTDLLAAPTLREFAHRVGRGTRTLPSLPDVVLLQPAGDRTPLFCFAGSGALALSFRQLARYFTDRRVYAFQAHGLERRGIPDRTVERAAGRALEFIRTVQPRGPYLLTGHSLGGLLALEVARRLVAAGEEVALVALLDTYLPRGMRTAPAATVAGDTTTTGPTSATAGASGAPAAPGRLAGWRQRLDPGEVPLPTFVADRTVRRLRTVVAGAVRFRGQRQYETFFDHGDLVSARHRPDPYPGNALMVFAENNPSGPPEWDAILTGPHRYVTVHSEHSSMLRDPHVVDVAAAVRTAVDAAETVR